MDEHGPPAPAVQAVLDRVPCGLLRTDRKGVILRANETCCRWLGYERSELIGRGMYELLTIGGRIFHQTHIAPMLHMQSSVAEVKLEMRHREGQAVPVVLNVQHFPGPQAFSELAFFVARDRDLYERELLLARRHLESVVAEEKLRRAEAKDRALLAEQMVGIVSHDLRNPLQTIQMGAGVLLHGEHTEQQALILGRIVRAGERARRLISELLDFTQARLGHGISVHVQSLDLHALVRDVLEELRQAFPERALVHEPLGAGPCAADGERIAQLVGNLVGNAMTYGDPEAPVTVRTQVGPEGFRVAVHNSGAAIPAEVQARMFEPLVRGTTADSATRSIGLGLFIVREIAKAHGGQVTVESATGRGTTFTASIPSSTV
ncbi:PAS domain-containing sensor histidine kinase [Ramlibacter rhizophilus]|uniref:PAS domain-containing sensor histidine kinase n=1 Tax=Ramlibacter rhizophilus TaxID=1781167 RepID=UPI001F0DA1E2|nr:PAS domain-containing sensor histidine kinase [Ramlibacter rhizophilus]